MLFLFSLIAGDVSGQAIDIHLHTLITHMERFMLRRKNFRINNIHTPVNCADCLCLLYFIKMIK